MAYSRTRLTVITPSVTRSAPSNSAIGGISDCSKLREAFKGFLKYFAAMDDVVPPQIMCFPFLEKNKDKIESMDTFLKRIERYEDRV